MKRYGKRIDWNAKAIAGFSAAVMVIFAFTQIPNYYAIWFWGLSTGHRSAGLSSGHYERKFPAISRGMPLIGVVLLSGSERTIVIDYDLHVQEGKASFAVWKWPIILNRPVAVGPPVITRSGQRRIEFAPGSAGLYRIFMHSYRLQGEASVQWHTEEQRRMGADHGG